MLKIQKIDGGGWYPTKGRVYFFNQDPEWTKGPNTMEMLLDNRFQNIPYSIMRMIAWDMRHIETVSDTTDLFRFEFPNDTEYYDRKSNTFSFTGDQKAYNDKVLRHRNVQQR